MKMVYLLYSLEKFLLNREIDNIKKNNDIEDINISHFDLNTDLIEDVIEDAETFSMFADKKMIIVSNSLVFSAKKNNIEQNLEVLEHYLNNFNPSFIIMDQIINSGLDAFEFVVLVLLNSFFPIATSQLYKSFK